MLYKILLSGFIIFTVIIAGNQHDKEFSKDAATNISIKKGTQLPFHLKNSGMSASFWETSAQPISTDPETLKKTDWYAEVLKGIAAKEYEIQYHPETKNYASPNRQQNMRAFYSNDHFTLLPRNDSMGKWKLDLQMKGVYAGNKKIYSTVKNARVSQNGNTIRFNNDDLFTTEYVNSKEGVRQNFIINKKPAAAASNINVRLQANEGWFVNQVNKKEIHFAKATKTGYDRKVTYNDLKVWDANHRELEASFAVNKNIVDIVVNSSDAVYPITIDPISTTAVTIVESNQANANMGFSVTSAGDVNGDGYSDIVVGAPKYDFTLNNDGAAFVYYGSATGISTVPAIILKNEIADSYFGFAVSTAGDVNGDGYSDLIVGAPFFKQGQLNEGAFYIFPGSAAGLSAVASTIIQSDIEGAKMGNAVSSAGDINGDGYSDVVVGAFEQSLPQSKEGIAYVYLGSAAGISIASVTMLERDVDNANFGKAVACAGDVNGDGYSDIIVGASGYSNILTNAGAAYVYHGGPAGINTTPSTTLLGNQGESYFGWSVSTAGDVNGDGYSDIIVGADRYNNGGEVQEGVAFVYLGSASGINIIYANLLEVNQAGARFGYCVSSAGDINGDGYGDVIIGAPFYTDATINEGAIYVFNGSATGLNATPTSTRYGGLPFLSLGWSVSYAGDINGDGYSDIVSGAPFYENPDFDEGGAFVFNGSADGLNNANNWTTASSQAQANYGISVASAGDVNSDGFSDVIVGAYIFDDGFTDNGKAFLYMGSANGLSTVAAWTGIGTQNNEYYGRCVAGAGDVNGDGYSDVLVGATGYTNGEFQEGRAYLYYGSAGGLSAAEAWTTESNVATGVMGQSLAGAGDVNGDGYADIIIGAPQFNSGFVNEGKVFIFYGRETVPDAVANWTATGNQAGAFFGASVAGLGDVNGDGYGDFIIGASNYMNTLSGEGAAFAYYGSNISLPLVPNWTVYGGQAGAQFGTSVAAAGDVNGDGFSDAIVGAYLLNGGKVFVYHGSIVGLSATANWTGVNNIFNTDYGYSVSSAGDVNGDGYSDVLVGARKYTNGQVDEGALYAYYGSPSGLSATVSWFLEGNVSNSLLGNSVASAGDVNGDGFSDIIAGAPYMPNPTYREGGAFVYYGNMAGGIRNNIKLYNIDLTTPIRKNNITNPNLFGAGFFAKSPLGRAKGKMSWDVQKQGDKFVGNPITNSTFFFSKQPSFSDLGLLGTELKYNVQKQGRQTKVRIRLEYDRATAITGQVYGPWRYPTGYTFGAYGMNSIPLPLTLISFNGQFSGADDVLLKWITTNEINMQNFVVERSIDGIIFTAVATLSAKGSGSSRADYALTDYKVKNNLLYYRLKLKEQNGDISYSHVITLNRVNIAKGTIAPNPVQRGSNAILSLTTTGNDKPVNIAVYSLNGGRLFNIDQKLNAGRNNIIIPASKLSKGMYLVKVTGVDINQSYKLLVQ